MKRALSASLVTAAVAGAVIATAATPGLAGAAPGTLSAITSARPCHVHQAGDHWQCVTPGAHCLATAHSGYGFAKSGQRYRCTRHHDRRWHWKRW